MYYYVFLIILKFCVISLHFSRYVPNTRVSEYFPPSCKPLIFASLINCKRKDILMVQHIQSIHKVTHTYKKIKFCLSNSIQEALCIIQCDTKHLNIRQPQLVKCIIIYVFLYFSILSRCLLFYQADKYDRYCPSNLSMSCRQGSIVRLFSNHPIRAARRL